MVLASLAGAFDAVGSEVFPALLIGRAVRNVGHAHLFADPDVARRVDTHGKRFRIEVVGGVRPAATT